LRAGGEHRREQRSGRADEREVVPLLILARARELDGPRDRVAKVDDLDLKLQLSPGDARDIE